MADIKISELEPTTDLEGLYTIGSDKNNLSKKVSLQFLKDAANYANEQGDYAKQAGDTVNGNVGVSDYPEFSASQSYVIGDIVRYNGVLYSFTANHAASAWNNSDVKATSINAITSGKLTELESEVIFLNPFDKVELPIVKTYTSEVSLWAYSFGKSTKTAFRIMGKNTGGLVWYVMGNKLDGGFQSFYQSNAVNGDYDLFIDLSEYLNDVDTNLYANFYVQFLSVASTSKETFTIEVLQGEFDLLKTTQKKLEGKVNENSKIISSLSDYVAYDGAVLTEVGLLSPNNGETLSGFSGYRCSDYLPTKGFNTLSYTGLFPNEGTNYCGLCLYNKDKEFISAIGEDVDHAIEGKITLGADVAYVRVADFKAKEPISLIFLKTSTIIKYRVNKGGNGDFSSLTKAVLAATDSANAEVYVEDGIYDIVQEYQELYGDNWEQRAASNKGLWLKNNIKIYFSSQAKVTFLYDGANPNIHSQFSPFNAGEYGFELHNLVLECKNCRYCIHDERDSSEDAYTNIYNGCTFFLDNRNNPNWNSFQCIGGGLGKSGIIKIENCVFESLGTELVVSYHNNSRPSSLSTIRLLNNYFKNGTFRLGYYGISTEISIAYLIGNSFSKMPYVAAETTSSNVVNMKIVSWNNEIRDTL